MLGNRATTDRSRIDRRAALQALVRIAGWPRLLVAAVGAAAGAGLVLVDYATGNTFRPELPYVLLFVGITWAGWAVDALVGAVVITVARVITVDMSGGLSLGAATAQELLSFGGLALVIGLTAWLRDAVLEAEQRANVDPLTGVLNGPVFEERVDVERQRSIRDGRPITLAFIDLDGFKDLNDTRGHRTGDAALVRFAEIVGKSTRPYDIVGRIGGDEFVILFPGTEAFDAFNILERVRKVAFLGHPSVAFSAGIATYLRPPESVDAMLREADDLMYIAKRRGGGHPVGRIVIGRGEPVLLPADREPRTVTDAPSTYPA